MSVSTGQDYVSEFLAQLLSFSYKLIRMLSMCGRLYVCLDVDQV